MCIAGKTVQAIALLACYRADWPALIITPSSLRGEPCGRHLAGSVYVSLLSSLQQHHTRMRLGALAETESCVSLAFFHQLCTDCVTLLSSLQQYHSRRHLLASTEAEPAYHWHSVSSFAGVFLVFSLSFMQVSMQACPACDQFPQA